MILVRNNGIINLDPCFLTEEKEERERPAGLLIIRFPISSVQAVPQTIQRPIPMFITRINAANDCGAMPVTYTIHWKSSDSLFTNSAIRNVMLDGSIISHNNTLFNTACLR